MQKKMVSVIIPTKNAGLILEGCLRSLKKQTYKQFEVLVVDNGSSDNTRKISQKYNVKFFTKGPERGAQKNYGVSKSLGKYVFFVDADMELTKNVIIECVNLSKTCSAIIIPEESIGSGFWNDCVILERKCYVDDDSLGGARFFPRAAFIKMGGFDTDLVASGDDLDLSQRFRRAGYKFGRIKAKILHYEGIRNPISTFMKWRYYGRDMGNYILKNKNEALIQYIPIRPAWIRHWRELIVDPIHVLGFILLKACNLAGVICGQVEAKYKSSKNSYNPYTK